MDHVIQVKTGDRKGAGTDANVKIVLYDIRGEKSPEIDLHCWYHDDFERGHTDTFKPSGLKHLSDITRIELWRDNKGIAPDWFCDSVMVTDVKRNKRSDFPIQKWLEADYHYMIPRNNTSLPQFDEFPLQRQYELDNKRTEYQLIQHAPELPMQVKKLPEDEDFTLKMKLFLETSKLKMKFISKFTEITVGEWENLTDLLGVYKFDHTFPEPSGTDRWRNDAWFGAQRLIGCNPKMIKLCTALPENMGVKPRMLRPFLEGRSARQVIADKRLFIVDYKILDGLSTKNNRPLCAPIGLFFLNGENQLIPIAIQLHQEIAKNNPVFLSDDPPFTWLLAKMWFNLADATVHESLTHLGLTHLLMEGVCVATHRHLASKHPIFKLLAPHFLFLLAINTQAVKTLISPGGWVDKVMTVGRKGMFKVIQRGMDEYRMDVNGNLKRDMETRGVSDPRVLPNYSYRDDAILVWEAIENYVTKIVEHYYDTPKTIKEDEELQGWIATIACSKKEGGLGIQGTPNNGQFESALDVISVCTWVIFTCSAEHAAVNFDQYDEYGFPPNYPLMLMKEPPRDKKARSEKDIVETIPDRDTTLETMVMVKLLSSRDTRSLGNWEIQYQYDPPALEAVDEFREQLKLISAEIQRRNQQRNPLYVFKVLDPFTIPNAISI